MESDPPVGRNNGAGAGAIDDQARNEVQTHVTRGFWTYISAVCVAGFSVLAVAALAAREELAVALAMAPLWIVLVLIVLGEVRPMVTASMTDAAGVITSAAFVFAGLLFFGLAVAALLHITAVVIAGIVHRKALWRTCFNAAQYTLSLASAWLVLSAFGVAAAPTATRAPFAADVLAIALAAAAYAITNHLLVWSTLSLAARRSFLSIVRTDVRYQLVVDASLFSVGAVTAVVLGHSPYLALLLLIPLMAVSQVGSAGAHQERLARSDGLTGLANRAALTAATDQALAAARGSGTSVAVLALDLDRFKPINDTLGHSVGDHVLRIIASRLETAVRTGDVVARLGGDEFVVLLTDVESAGSVEEVAARLRVALIEPMVVDGHPLRVGASIGIGLFPDHGEDLETLLRKADRAMYADKARGAVPAAPTFAQQGACAVGLSGA